MTAWLLTACWRHAERPATVAPVPRGPPACLTDEPRHYRMARVDADLVLCGESDDWDVGWGHDTVRLEGECYTLRADGTLRARPFEPLVGIGFAYDGPCAGNICWSAKRARIAFHPDGKRAALIDQRQVKILDVASGHTTSEFEADIPGNFWFVGETVYIASAPAGPGASLRAFALDGTETHLSDGLWHGGVTLTDAGHLMYQANGLTSLTILDGKSPPQPPRTRSVPAGPCEAMESGFEWTADEDEACKAYLAQHYVPYDRALVIGDGARLVGFQPERREVFTLDPATLAEQSRVRVKTCRQGQD